MRVLILGGNRFMGRELVIALAARGDQVTTLHRGSLPHALPAPVASRVEELLADRTTAQLAQALAGREFDAVVDFCCFTAADARGLLAAIGSRARHLITISTGQVYLVRQGCPRPAREKDYEGSQISAPPDPHDLENWSYGIAKREMEDTLAAAHGKDGLAVTRVRIPVVHGPRDNHRRLESYLWRLLDGGPVILPDGGEKPMRPIASFDVASTLASWLLDARTYGRAWNLAQEETPTLREIVEGLAAAARVPARIVGFPSERLLAAGLPPQQISLLSTRWTSFLDATDAKTLLAFRPTPWPTALARIATALLAHPGAEPPPGYEHRPRELALAGAM